MKQIKDRKKWSALVCAGLFFGVVQTTAARNVKNEEEEEKVALSLDEAKFIQNTLERVLRKAKAPRDGADITDPEYPVSSCDAAELAEIKKCVCIIKGRVGALCSKVELIEESLELICSKIEDVDIDLESIGDVLCSKLEDIDDSVGDPDGLGSCFDTIVTREDIDGANLNVIEWLKTLMYELRGVCPCVGEEEPPIYV